MPSQLELAWAVGLFEGEGSCFVNARNRINVTLAMVDRDVMERFAEIVGCGTLRSYERRPPRQTVWQWHAGSRDEVIPLLESFMPLLGERRRQAARLVLDRAHDVMPLRGPRPRCRHGHSLLEPENVYTHRKTGKRQCVACRRERARCRVR